MPLIHPDLATFIDGLPLISVHEHHQDAAWQQQLDLDRLLQNSYVNWLAPAAGPVSARETFLSHVRHNAYFVWLERALQRIYGVGKVTAEAWEEISARIQAAHTADAQWHITVMQQCGNIRAAIQDAYWDPGTVAGHPEYFSSSFRISALVLCHHAEMRDHNNNSPWQSFGITATSFDTYLEQVEALIAERKAQGAVALKSGIAYDRSIAIIPRERAEAQTAFGKHPSEVTPQSLLAFQDFMFDYLCGLAAKYDLPLQNHTGLALIAGSNPMGLEQMIARHPGTKFVLFHGGYPWVHEIAGLAHNYSNVYPDLTWLPIISPTAAEQAIGEWLDVAQSSRHICWGGDAWTGEESVGAALAFKQVLTLALSRKVAAGYYDLDDAEAIARRLCAENACYVYGVGASSA